MDADFRLLSQMKRGEEEAIECFVRKYYPSILQYCHYHLQEIHDAEDLTQETFARFFASLDRYKHYGKAANYLYVIAGNLWPGPLPAGSRNSPLPTCPNRRTAR